MAVVRVMENFLDSEKKVLEAVGGTCVRDLLRDETVGSAYSDTMVECYDCETGMTFYAPMSDSDSLNVVVMVNGNSKDLDYIIEEKDVVSVVFLPASEEFSWAGAIVGGIVGAVAGGVLGFFAGGIPGAILGAIGGAALGFGAGFLIQNYDKLFKRPDETNGSGKSGLDSDKLPDVRGSQNQPLNGQPFPAVLGKILTTPFIIGSTYNEAYGKRGEEIYIHALYVVGYAPLRITDLRLGEQMLAHNQKWDGNAGMKTVFHGQLSGTYSEDGADTGDIVNTWSTNDIMVEILQQGQDGETVDWGSIYPYAKLQDDIGANCLYIVDGDTDSKSLVSYQGVSLMNGLRNNPVKFTRQCPLSARVELDFPQGLYKTRSNSDDDGNSSIEYSSIPLWTAIQWRVFSEANAPSDAERHGVIEGELDQSSEDYWWDADNGVALTDKRGWHTFENVNSTFGNVTFSATANLINIHVSHYPDRKYAYGSGEALLNDGECSIQLDSPAIFNIPVVVKINFTIEGSFRATESSHYDDCFSARNSKTILFEETIPSGNTSLTFTLPKTYITCYKEIRGDHAYDGCSGNCKISIDADIQVMGATLTKSFSIGSGVYDGANLTATFSNQKTFEQEQMLHTFDSAARTADKNAHTGNTIGTINDGWLGAEVFNLQPLCGSWEEKEGINEFRVCTEVDFEKWARENFHYEDEADFIRQFKAYFLPSSNTTKSVEVRVIRISPNYINETTSSRYHSAYQFNDVFQWKTLTSTMFDENELVEGGRITKQRPLNESDMRKLCVVAIRASTDRTDQLSNVLKKFTCTAQSFSPYYDSTAKKWVPTKLWDSTNSCWKQGTGVEKKFKYYKPNTIVGGKVIKGQEITEEQFIADRQASPKVKSIKLQDGNNFTHDIITKVLRIQSNIDERGRYIIPDDKPDEFTLDGWNLNPAPYIENNVASVIMLAGIGRHVGIDAMDYDDYNLVTLGQVFEFCKEVRDGSQYSSEGYHYDHDGNQVHHNKGDEVVMYFTANAYIYEAKKLEDILAGLCIAGRCVYTRDDMNRLTFIIDKPEKYHVALINQANTLSSSYTISYAELPAGIMGTYKDENDGYNQNEVYCFKDGESRNDYRGKIESFAVDYVTNPYQMWSLGRYILANRIMNREVVTKKIGMEGVSIGLGNIVCVQDDTMMIGTDFGGRITRLIEDDDYIYGFIINNTYHVSGELSSAAVPHENTLSAPLDFPYSATASGSTIRFSIPSGTEINDDFTASALVTYADETSEAKELSFVPVKVYNDNPDKPMYVLINSEDNLAGTNGMGIVLRAELSAGVQSWIEDNDIGEPWARFYHVSLTYKWYKNSTLITGETGNICRIYEPGEYKVVIKLSVWYTYESYEELTFSCTKTVVNTDENTGYCSYPTKSVFFIPVDDNDETIGAFSAFTDIKLYKNKTEIHFGIERYTNEDKGQGCVIMQPSQYQESRIINLRLAPLGTTIDIDGKPFTVKKGESNVVVLADKISKNDITSEGGVVYVYKPQVDNIIGFGEIGKETALYRVIKIKPDNKHNYELTLLKYQPELYEYGRQLPSFQSNISRKQEEVDSYNLSGAATAADLSAAIKQASDITVAKGLSITAPDGTVFKNGLPASLTIEAQPSGYTPDTYKWYLNDTLIPGAESSSYSASQPGVYKCVAESGLLSFEAYMTLTAVSDGQDGGHQSYIFAVGAFGLDDSQARALTWYDAPPTVPDGQCLYMATKWIEG